MLHYLVCVAIWAAIFMGHISGGQWSFLDVYDKTQKPYPNHYVILSSRPGAGMFSLFDDVFDLIKRYELGQYKGIEVDFDTQGLYYDPKHGNNWWGYYFAPISLGKKNNIKKIMYPVPKPPQYIIFSKKEATHRKEIFDLIQKYFRVKPHIQKKIDIFDKKNFKNRFVIAVHYRGTDKAYEAPPVPYEKIKEEVLNVMKTYGDQKYKIFIATDEQGFLDYMINCFGDRVCYNKNALRSINGKPVHLDKKLSRYKSGEDAVIDCILLSRGNFLIRTSSNLSRWSTYFNPNIPVAVLNSQYFDFAK